MKGFLPFFFAASLFTSLFLAGLSFFAYRKNHLKGFRHLTELGLALALHVCLYVLLTATPQMMALSMLGWPWALRAVFLVHRELAQDKRGFWSKGLSFALALGALFSLGLGLLDLAFVYQALPFSLAFGVAGLRLSYGGFLNSSREHYFLEKWFFVFSSLFFVHCLLYPFWQPFVLVMEFGLLISLISIIGLSISGPVMMLDVVRSFSEKSAEEIERARTDKLVKNAKYSELGMMAAGIAHEINNPLAVIQARSTQLLRLYRDPERQKELAEGLEQVLYTSERINRTVQGIREFVHDQHTRPMEIRLRDLIDDVLAFCGQRMKNHGVNLRFYDLGPYSVWGNKIQLEQILLNLLNNSFDAIEYLPDKWIEISAQQSDHRVSIIVKDSGRGIPKEIASHIMEPFFSTKEVGKGTGLGLALARGIAEKHGGVLRYMEGTRHTTFVLELPQGPQSEWGEPLMH